MKQSSSRTFLLKLLTPPLKRESWKIQGEKGWLEIAGWVEIAGKNQRWKKVQLEKKWLGEEKVV